MTIFDKANTIHHCAMNIARQGESLQSHMIHHGERYEDSAIKKMLDDINRFIYRIEDVLDARTIRKCRICGCTDDNCIRCIEKTGRPCRWIEEDLCSACKYEGGKK